MFTPELIPAWLISIITIYTGLMWFILRNKKVKIDYRPFAFTFVLQGIVYGIIFQFFTVPMEERGFYSRLMVVMLSVSQAFPLTLAYLRSLLHNGDN